jgi:hypothetical protein
MFEQMYLENPEELKSDELDSCGMQFYNATFSQNFGKIQKGTKGHVAIEYDIGLVTVYDAEREDLGDIIYEQHMKCIPLTKDEDEEREVARKESKIQSVHKDIEFPF